MMVDKHSHSKVACCTSHRAFYSCALCYTIRRSHDAKVWQPSGAMVRVAKVFSRATSVIEGRYRHANVYDDDDESIDDDDDDDESELDVSSNDDHDNAAEVDTTSPTTTSELNSPTHSEETMTSGSRGSFLQTLAEPQCASHSP